MCCATPAGTTETASRGCATFWRSASAARRGRRDPVRLAVGDTLDFWRVEAFEKDRLLRLSSEMKTPDARTIFRTAESPSVAKTMKLVMSKIGPAQLAVEDVAVSRVRLL